MSGKRDQASQDAAIEKLTGALPHANIIRAHLGEILNAAAFKGSRRSREFLTHVVECALAGQWSRLKERSLGVEVFGRDPSYDTGGDSIVRVTASDVRRRLLQYYSENPPAHSLRIEISAGSYIPGFNGLDECAAIDAQSKAADGLPPNGGSATPAAAWSAIGRGRGHRVVLSLCVVCFAWIVGLLSARIISGFSVKAGSRFELYRSLLGPIATDPAAEPEIALSNPRLWAYVGSNDPANPSLPSGANVRVPPELERMLNLSNEAQAKYPFHFLTLADQGYTDVGEAMAASNLSQLMRNLGHSPHLTESRFLNWGAVAKGYTILLGAPLMNAWAQENLARSNFTMEHDAITNAVPLPGEQHSYASSVRGDILDDYGLIWMARSSSGAEQLLLAGLTGTGTAAVSDFFCDPERMRPVYEHLRNMPKGGALASGWQILLHIHARENMPLRVSAVSLRVDGVNP